MLIQPFTLLLQSLLVAVAVVVVVVICHSCGGCCRAAVTVAVADVMGHCSSCSHCCMAVDVGVIVAVAVVTTFQL